MANTKNTRQVKAKSRIKSGDTVIVTTGKYKGKTGEVLAFCDDNRIKVMGVNMVKRHTRGNPQRNEAGGIIEKEAPIHISNVSIYNHSSSKADKVGYKTLEDGSKVRIFKSSQEEIDV